MKVSVTEKKKKKSVVPSPWIARLGVNRLRNIEYVPISISELQVSILENEVPNMEFFSAP